MTEYHAGPQVRNAASAALAKQATLVGPQRSAGPGRAARGSGTGGLSGGEGGRDEDGQQTAAGR